VVITFPTVAAHMLGQLVKYLGPNRLNFGTDAIWHGAPQWQIEALWRFQIPAEMRARYGYPELTEQVKRQILGLNSARIYGLDPNPRSYAPVPPDFEAHIPDHLKRTLGFPPPGAGADRLTQIREAYVEFGAEPSLMPAGWVNAARQG
jgi:hypothetical protein